MRRVFTSGLSATRIRSIFRAARFGVRTRCPHFGLRFTDAHHVRHWADGGETSLPNLLLLCFHHHRLVHEADWKVEWWGRDRPAFVDPRGKIPKQVYFRALEALGEGTCLTSSYRVHIYIQAPGVVPMRRQEPSA